MVDENMVYMTKHKTIIGICIGIGLIAVALVLAWSWVQRKNDQSKTYNQRIIDYVRPQSTQKCLDEGASKSQCSGMLYGAEQITTCNTTSACWLVSVHTPDLKTYNASFIVASRGGSLMTLSYTRNKNL